MHESRIGEAVVTAALLLACSDDEAEGTKAGGAHSEGGAPSLIWQNCGADECACLDVPVAYDDEQYGTTSVCAMRIAALAPEERIGTLFVIEGGPGVSAIETGRGVRAALQSADGRSARQFDMVFFDRRGVASSGAFECVDADWLLEARTAPLWPSGEAEWASTAERWRRFGMGCQTATPPGHLAHLGSDTFARDLDRWREALGEDEVSLIGFSHGTLAVAAYAALFPSRIRAGIMDAPVLPYGGYLSALFESSIPAREAALDAFFERCGGDTECAFHGGSSDQGVAAAYDALSQALAAAPLTLSDGRPFGPRNLAVGVGSMIGADPHGFDQNLSAALAAAAAGDAAALDLEGPAAQGRQRDGSYTSARMSVFHAAYVAEYGCAFSTVEEARARFAELESKWPRLGGTVPTASLACIDWPATRPPGITLAAPSAPPLLAVAATGDLSTPLHLADAMLDALGNGSHLLKRNSTEHVSFYRSPCVGAEIVEYLVDPMPYTLPEDACP